jgi:uncharacterized protein YjiK
LPWILAGVVSIGAAQPATVPWERCLEAGEPVARWNLPARFREASGLALSDDGRLWVHNDEAALIGALDPTTGQVIGAYRFGQRVQRGDFEGIAVAESRLYLVTSSGRLYTAGLPARSVAEAVLPFEVIETGVGKQCEVEGLGHDPRLRLLLLACKTPRAKSLADRVAIFRWSLATRALAEPDRVVIPLADLRSGRSRKGFHPSAIERDPATGHWLLIASADNGYALVDSGGRVLRAGDLRRGHPQPEGLALDARGRLYLSDEGGPPSRPGRVTVYACR